MTTAPDAPEKKKRALSDLSPPHRRGGDPAASAVLFDAFLRASKEDPDALTHGFHVYPARMHRAVAATVLDAWAPAGTNVVDPFCGSGTVLVEGRVRGLHCTGVDLSPLAVRLAALKSTFVDDATLQAWQDAAHEVAERAKERTRAKEDVRAPISKEEASRFAPHVLKALAAVHAEVSALKDDATRRALMLVFSSLLTKLAEKKSDTDARDTTKRIGRFLPAELFARKADELVERLYALAAEAQRRRTTGSGALVLMEQDMRGTRLKRAAELILTSPPYGGTYDYASHHDGRIEWLGLDDKKLDKAEIGARRRMQDAPASMWDDEVAAMLAAFARQLSPTGRAVIVMGDGEIGGTRVPLLPQLARLAPAAGLTVVASASAPRRDWRGRGEREEHVVLLVRTPAAPG